MLDLNYFNQQILIWNYIMVLIIGCFLYFKYIIFFMLILNFLNGIGCGLFWGEHLTC